MIKQTTLENGLRIISHHMSSVESVSFAVYNKVGSRDESKEINGTAHFLEHMAFKGTTTRSATEIVETIDRVGGSINAATGKDITKYTVDLLAEDLSIGVDIITKSKSFILLFIFLIKIQPEFIFLILNKLVIC